MASESTTAGIANAGLLQKVGATSSAGALGVLLLAASFARDAFESQLEATENAVDAIEELGAAQAATQGEVAGLKDKLEAVEATEQRGRVELETKLRGELDALRGELDALRVCVEEGRRCKR